MTAIPCKAIRDRHDQLVKDVRLLEKRVSILEDAHHTLSNLSFSRNQELLAKIAALQTGCTVIDVTPPFTTEPVDYFQWHCTM